MQCNMPARKKNGLPPMQNLTAGKSAMEISIWSFALPTIQLDGASSSNRRYRYARVVGESWPLTLERSRIEAEALKLAARRVPDLVPAVYFYDDQLALTVMEDLSDHIILRKGLITGEEYPRLAKDLAEYLALRSFHFGILPGCRGEKGEGPPLHQSGNVQDHGGFGVYRSLL